MDIVCQKCGSINDYRTVETTHLTAYCNGCDAYIKHLPKANNKDLVIYFGKYKNTPLKEFTTKEHVSWLKWAIANTGQFKHQDKERIIKHLNGQ